MNTSQTAKDQELRDKALESRSTRRRIDAPTSQSDVVERLNQLLLRLERILSSLGQCPSSPDPLPMVPDDLSAHLARKTLLVSGHLLNRDEAAAYTRRSPKTFDKTIRPQIRNCGSPKRHLYLKTDLDECLRRKPLGPSENNLEADGSSSGSRTMASAMKNPQVKRTLEKLRK